MPALAQAREPILLGLTPVFVDTDPTLPHAIKEELTRRLGTLVALAERRTYADGLLL